MPKGNDILECSFLDQRLNRIIILAAAALVLISIVVIGVINNMGLEIAKDLVNTRNVECELPELRGDGICDDPVNNFQCNFDDGDCCSWKAIRTNCMICMCRTKIQALDQEEMEELEASS